MSVITFILAFFSRWIADVASALMHLNGLVRPGRKIELTEQDDGSYAAVLWRKGAPEPLNGSALRLDDDRFVEPVSPRLRALLARSRIDVALSPSRFIFRPLDLPRAAEPFLEGVVRAQIDRLTPWSAADAVFGWSAPKEAGADRIAVTVAATARAALRPLSQALAATRAGAIAMSTRAGEDRALVIPIAAEAPSGGGAAGRLRFWLAGGLAAAGLAFIASLGAWIYLGAQYDARLTDAQSEIAARRAKLMSPQDSGAEQAVRSLEAKKRATPSAVMILEALTKALPDDAHLTELRIEDGKVQISGLTNDASPLIRLIEQSPQFAHATFFAPTVRNPNGGETFHIEARLEPSFAETN